MDKKTSIGLEENIAGALCYLLGWVTGLIFLIIEKDNKFVRFHAMQSLIAFGFLTAFNIFLLTFLLIPVIGKFVVFSIGSGISLLTLFLWIFLMYKAYSKELYKLPIAGDIAEKYI